MTKQIVVLMGGKSGEAQSKDGSNAADCDDQLEVYFFIFHFIFGIIFAYLNRLIV